MFIPKRRCMGKKLYNIRWCDSSKPFLSGSIPDLQLHFFSTDGDRSYLEINANCRDVTAWFSHQQQYKETDNKLEINYTIIIVLWHESLPVRDRLTPVFLVSAIAKSGAITEV